MFAKILPMLLVPLTLAAASRTIPVAQSKEYIEKHSLELLEKEGVNLAKTPQPIVAALYKKIHILSNRIRRKRIDTITQNELIADITKLIHDFAITIRGTITNDNVEQIVNDYIEQCLCEYDLSSKTIPGAMKSEFELKKDFVVSSLKKTLKKSQTTTVADVMILVHTIFDLFIQRLEHMKIAEIGNELLEHIDPTKKPSESALPMSLAAKHREQK